MINRVKYKHYQPVRVIYRVGLLNEGNIQARVVLRSILVNNSVIFGILVNIHDVFPLIVFTANTQDIFI